MRPAVLFGLTFLVQSLTLFRGIDLTDTGHVLMLARLAVESPPDPRALAPEIFFSSYVGGLWLSLWPEPSLLWARLGGTLLYALTSLAVYGVLSSHFGGWRSFFMTLACCLLPTMRYGIDLIDYYSWPAFLVTLHLFFLDRLLRSDRPVWAALLGFSALPIVLSRISLVSLALYPVAVLAFALLTRRPLKLGRRSLLALAGGFLAGLALMVALSLASGVGSLYLARVEGLLGGQSNLHAPSRLAELYTNQMISIALRTLAIVVALLVLMQLERVKPWLPSLLFPLGVLGGLLLQGRFSDNVDRDAFACLRFVVGLTYVYGLFLLAHHRRLPDRLCFMLVASLATMTCAPLGSGAGLDKIFYGMWLPVPLVLMTAWEEAPRFPSRFLALAPGLVAGLVVFSVYFKSSAIYNDSLSRSQLDTAFAHPGLAGILSTPRRVAVVDRALAQIEQRSRPGDEILLMTSSPLLYYLADRRPALGNAWLMLDPLDKIRSRQDQAEREGRLPVLFGFLKANTYLRTWPDSPQLWPQADREKATYLLDQYLGRLGYQSVYEDEDFALFAR